MLQNLYPQKRSKLIALFLTGLVSQSLLPIFIPEKTLAQSPAATAACAEISAPLTPEEQVYAKAAWQYFVNNSQEATGFTNSTGGYPSGTLWDMGNYLMALNSARWLNLIDQAEFDGRINKFLTGMSALKLFEDGLPNKVYNTATGQMVDYGNNPIEKGIGWSALDIGRILAAFHVIRTCHPQYGDWLKGIVAKWQVARSVEDEQLYGAMIDPNKTTLLVQEGRLGYEEYGARGYELWGFKVPKAIAVEPFKLVEINGIKVPVDTRDYQTTNANNYVVSESYILDAIEFGLEGYLKDYAASVLEVQKRRFEATGQLTAVSEDNIDQAPYFLYNTVHSNGQDWATITDENKPFPQLRSISTKAAIGWYYLYPGNAYAKQLFDAVKDLRDPNGGGFYAGLYEETKKPNTALTGNTNGLILEILYYKARGNRPLIGPELVSFASAPPTGNTISPAESTAAAPTPPPATPAAQTPPLATPAAQTPPPATPAAQTPPPATPTPAPVAAAPPKPAAPEVVAVGPIPPVGKPEPSECPAPARSLNVVERRYADAAWGYFKANYQKANGLVDDRSDMKAATLWGLGDYLAALHAARSLEIISDTEFDGRTRQLLAALGKLPLFAGELPQRGYDSRTLQPVDYGGNPLPEGNGFSALDIGRMMAALYNLKNCHPQYTNAVDQVVLDWSYLRVVRDGVLSSASVEKDANGRWLARVNPETRLGYEEYAARAFQMWGFDVNRAAVGGEYKTESVGGVEVPVQRNRANVNSEVNHYTVSNPFLVYGLEFGFDPQMRSLVEPLLQAQAERYRSTGNFTSSATTLIDRAPYNLHSTIIGDGKPWATIADDGTSAPELRMVSTAAAFAYYALFPENEYARELWQATTDLYNPSLGFYEGFYEKTGKTAVGFTGSTNSTILQSLLFMVTKQPLISPATAMDSPWWQEVAKGNSGRGLPEIPTQKAKVASDASGTYWTSGDGTVTSPTSAK
ncbi:DUF3131 domain-containing protein [Microcoleus sp. FACHB-672]|uniref:DUF3131 domain-containing protein n=1 Tax=Microcoleus sp. FACHB-672 TaxID=2692825 RepID=UPI001683C3B7|nr:DUF3131 domain-containing protein [Microcoleus sp. FACHB-672]MBD2041059.1 DUF3131 domain-containing protein [Microcoleus sp. FACHB-672]